MNTAVQCYRQQQSTGAAEREALILAHLPLVRKVASRIAAHLPASVDLKDLVSAGCLGLLSATERFDPGRGLEFATFAEFRIKGAILDELRSLDTLPRRRRSRFHQLERVRRELQHSLGREPSEDEMAAALGMPRPEYTALAADLTPAMELSLTLLERGSGELQLGTPEDQTSPETQMIRSELRRRLVQAIRALPERQRSVISLYYYARLTYDEIALLYDVTASRICQIHRLAIQQLREQLSAAERGEGGEP
jgi:RNA polymerase sigma factor FliA